jgi:branched-chain amino acid transport system substrate-binding protein
MRLTRRNFVASATALAAASPWRTLRAAEEPIRIGWMQALTGANSAPGIAFNRGINFAVDEINAAGGVGGRKIELITRDTQGDPTRAVNSAQEMVRQLKVIAILGPSNSGETLAVTPIIARAHVPMIHAGVIDGLIDPVKFPNAYRTGASNAQWEAAAGHYAVDILKHKKIAVIGDNSGYGTVAVQDSSADLKHRGADIVSTSLVDLNAPDLTAELIRARDAGAEAVLAWSASSGLLARLLNARGDVKWDAPVIGHPSLGSGDVAHLLTKPAYWEKVYQVGFRTCCFDQNGKLPAEQAAFVQKLAGKVELSGTNLWWVAWGYDALRLVADTAHATGDTAPAAMIAGLNKVTNYPGLYGAYSFTPEQHNGYPDSSIVMSVANTFRDGAFTIAPGY